MEGIPRHEIPRGLLRVWKSPLDLFCGSAPLCLAEVSRSTASSRDLLKTDVRMAPNLEKGSCRYLIVSTTHSTPFCCSFPRKVSSEEAKFRKLRFHRSDSVRYDALKAGPR